MTIYLQIFKDTECVGYSDYHIEFGDLPHFKKKSMIIHIYIK